MSEEKHQRTADSSADTEGSGSGDELSLGYSEKFETQWWHIEIGLWVFLCVVVCAGLAGILGRGPLAHKIAGTSDSALQVEYQRMSRYKTPEAMTVRIAPSLYRDNKAQLWINKALIQKAGLQRIMPQPLQSIPGEDGVAFVFPVADPTKPTLVFFAKEATAPGLHDEEVRTDADHDLHMRSIVLP